MTEFLFLVHRHIEANKWGDLKPSSDHEHFGVIENWLGENCGEPFHVTKTNDRPLEADVYWSLSQSKFYQPCTMAVRFTSLVDYTKCVLHWG